MARKMKDSGIEWIGEIPKGWEVHRMKSCISQRDGGAWGDEATGETGDCICLRIADFDYEHFRFTDSNNLTIRHYASPIIKKLLLQKNDILIEKSGGGEKTPVGRTVLFDKEYPALFANFMDRLRCSDFILPQYLQYVFVTFYKNRYTQNYIKQTTGIQNLDLSSMLADEFVPVPNLNEQKLIVCYLESKCSKIDNLLSKTRSSIEEYKKLKQAVITQAVTKGVRGEREMKDSGNPWFGQIPTDWKLSRVGLHFSIILGKMLCNAPLNDTYTLEPYYCAADVHFDGVADGERKKMWFSPIEKDLYRVSVGDLLVVEGGAGAGGSAIVEKQDSYTYIQNSIMIVRSKGNTDNRYLRYLLEFLVKQGYIDIVCNKATIPHFTKDKLSGVPFCLCPTGEQEEIADYLDAKCAEIDGLIAKKEQLVKELENYKKSLIFEYVTGKKELRR